MCPEAWVPGTVKVRISPVPGEGGGQGKVGQGDVHTRLADTSAAGAHGAGKSFPGDSRKARRLVTDQVKSRVQSVRTTNR